MSAQVGLTVVRIANPDRLDPINVYLADEGGGRGRMTVFCYNEAWTCYWGAMGERTLRQFVAGCDASYVAGNMLSGRQHTDHDRAYAERIAAAVIAEFVNSTSDQQAPATPPVSATTAQLIALLQQRDAHGLVKYGVTLDRTDLSHADWTQHAVEELLDCAGYLLARQRTHRDQRQALVAGWCAAAFGDAHAASIPQRGIRLAEEAIEAAQAAGCDKDMVHSLVNYVYARPVGELRQELGGVGLTLLALAAAADISADDAEAVELARVLSKPLAHFESRNAAKNAAGFNVIPEIDRSPPPPTCAEAIGG